MTVSQTAEPVTISEPSLLADTETLLALRQSWKKSSVRGRREFQIVSDGTEFFGHVSASGGFLKPHYQLAFSSK
jgi:hypothetical protein